MTESFGFPCGKTMDKHRGRFSRKELSSDGHEMLILCQGITKSIPSTGIHEKEKFFNCVYQHGNKSMSLKCKIEATYPRRIQRRPPICWASRKSAFPGVDPRASSNSGCEAVHSPIRPSRAYLKKKGKNGRPDEVEVEQMTEKRKISNYDMWKEVKNTLTSSFKSRIQAGWNNTDWKYLMRKTNGDSDYQREHFHWS